MTLLHLARQLTRPEANFLDANRPVRRPGGAVRSRQIHNTKPDMGGQQRPAAGKLTLSREERAAIDSDPWFSSLSPALRHDILRCVYIKHFEDGDPICTEDRPSQAWFACARGAMKACTVTQSGRQITLAYAAPGTWFGKIPIIEGSLQGHGVYAHGRTHAVCVAKADFRQILTTHVEFYEALLQLHARRIDQLIGVVTDCYSLPLRSRLAKQIWHLAESFGAPLPNPPCEIRIGLQLAQDELAQLVGASRQRVNQELKAMERENAIRVENACLVVCDAEILLRIAETGRPGSSTRCI